MLSRAMDRGNDRPIRWSAPAWDRNSTEWLAIDQSLPAGHVARVIDRLVGELDLTDLRTTYAGRGSCPHRPELLLRLVLYESWNGVLSPSQWHDRGRIVKRNEHDDLVEELRDRIRSPQSQEFYAKRKQAIEPTFGDFLRQKLESL